MSTEEKLASFVISSKYEDLPQNVIDITKKDIIDTLGTTLAGSGAPGCKEVVDLTTELGGRADATVLVYGGKVPAPEAAFANGTMAHALDYDDTHDQAVLHVGVSVIPAALAVAEYLGEVNGKDFVTAVALGSEIVCRLGMATKRWGGWILTPLYGYFGAATAAAKLLGLTEDGMLNAWGITYAQASGNGECVASGSWMKRVQAGLAARGGTFSALLAKKGVTGARESLEGRAGLFNVYQGGEYDRNALTRDLGSRFDFADLSFKPYPCCRWNHTAIDAALELVQKYNINSDEIESATVGVGKEAFGLCQPVEVKYAPRTIVDAQFSIPYNVGTAFAKRGVTIQDFTEKAIKEPRTLGVIAKLTCNIDPEVANRPNREISPTRVSVRMKNGQEFSSRVDFPKGHPKNPMIALEFIEKFRKCAGFAVKPLSARAVDRALDMATNIEKVSDVGLIAKALGGSRITRR
ncbi:MAG: MmgE/PrpD family protein [Chloroflexota bacterium]